MTAEQRNERARLYLIERGKQKQQDDFVRDVLFIVAGLAVSIPVWIALWKMIG